MLSDLLLGIYNLGVEGPDVFKAAVVHYSGRRGVLLATLSAVLVVVYLSHWVGLICFGLHFPGDHVLIRVVV